MKNNNFPFCVNFYLKSREFSNEEDILPSDIGINWIKPFQGFQAAFLKFIKTTFANNKILFYTRPGGDLKDRQLIADLLNLYLGRSVFQYSDLILTNSSSEALEIYFEFISRKKAQLILPLPCYFKYDLLAIRKNINIFSYYNISSDTCSKFKSSISGSLCLLINNPDAISGKIQSQDFYNKIADSFPKPFDFFLYDFCYLILDNKNKGVTHDFIDKSLKSGDLANSTFTFSPSKDISLASLRAGLLVSKNKELIDYAKDKILERYFTLNVMSMYAMIIYITSIIFDKYSKCHMLTIAKEVKAILKKYNYDHSFLSNDFIHKFIDYQHNNVIKYINSNFSYMSEYNNLFDYTNYSIPDAGFSSLWKLKAAMPNARLMIKTIQNAAINQRINIFPAYFYGGNEEIWKELYPDDFFIRINSSLPREVITRQFNALTHLFL